MSCRSLKFCTSKSTFAHVLISRVNDLQMTHNYALPMFGSQVLDELRSREASLQQAIKDKQQELMLQVCMYVLRGQITHLHRLSWKPSVHRCLMLIVLRSCTHFLHTHTGTTGSTSPLS